MWTEYYRKGWLPDPKIKSETSIDHRSSGSSWATRDSDVMKALMEINASIKGIYRSNTDDLTFIIPYATADRVRFEAMICTVGWILSTTSAKVIIYSAETEDGFNTAYYQNGPDAPTPYRKKGHITWKQYSDPAFSKEEREDFLVDRLVIDVLSHLYEANLLLKSFNYDIFEQKHFIDLIKSRVSFLVEPRKNGERFHRTRYLNEMLDKVTTPYVCNHDADTLLSRHGLMTSIFGLRTGVAQMSYPFQLGTDSQKRINVKNTHRPSPLSSSILTGDMSVQLGNRFGLHEFVSAYGQSIIFNTSIYKAIGGENENFISWGAEDMERFNRAVRLGVTVARIDAPIFHIEHPRGSDSSDKNPMFQSNEGLWNKLVSMSAEELKQYYDNVEYRKKYSW